MVTNGLLRKRPGRNWLFIHGWASSVLLADLTRQYVLQLVVANHYQEGCHVCDNWTRRVNGRSSYRQSTATSLQVLAIYRSAHVHSGARLGIWRVFVRVCASLWLIDVVATGHAKGSDRDKRRHLSRRDCRAEQKLSKTGCVCRTVIRLLRFVQVVYHGDSVLKTYQTQTKRNECVGEGKTIWIEFSNHTRYYYYECYITI